MDRVLGGDDVGVFRAGAGDHVLDGRPREILGAARGYLDDAVASRLREAPKGGVEGLRRRDVDGGIGEGTGLRAVEHLGVDLRGGDGHA
jgi:hypothetical protein